MTTSRKRKFLSILDKENFVRHQEIEAILSDFTQAVRDYADRCSIGCNLIVQRIDDVDLDAGENISLYNVINTNASLNAIEYRFFAVSVCVDADNNKSYNFLDWITGMPSQKVLDIQGVEDAIVKILEHPQFKYYLVHSIAPV